MIGIDAAIIGALVCLGGTLVVVTLKEVKEFKITEKVEKEKKQEKIKIKKDDLELSEMEDYSDLLK